MPDYELPAERDLLEKELALPRALRRIEQLERDLAESRKATERVQVALIEECDGGALRLLTLFALAVTHMRWLQSDEQTRQLPDWQARVVAAELEVDDLARLHLTPSALRPGA